jgi:hypothetical protein
MFFRLKYACMPSGSTHTTSCLRAYVCEIISLIWAQSNSLRAGVPRRVHVCSTYRSNRDCTTKNNNRMLLKRFCACASVQNISPVETAILYQLLKSCNRKRFLIGWSANRCRGHYEMSAPWVAHHDFMSVTWPCTYHLTDKYLFFLIFEIVSAGRVAEIKCADMR